MYQYKETIYFFEKIEITTLQKLTVQKLFQVYKLTYSTYIYN
jgi:hypothetical protein